VACSAAGAAGLAGSLACAVAMVLATLGLGGATTAAGMAGMDGATSRPGGLLGLLLRIGPGLLAASAVLVAAAFVLRRPGAAVPALLAGAVLYAGMYLQPNRPLMYASIALGYTGWAALYLWVRNLTAVREQGYPSHRGARQAAEEVHDGHHPGPGA
jgi:hypothetical protein